MTKSARLVLPCLLIVFGTGFTRVQNSQIKTPALDISGEWTGTWASYNPAQGGSTPKELCKRLDAKVEQKDGVFQAVFEGDCGRPYTYSIRMQGRQVGKVVLFQGTSDLGEKDGGVFDWIGRANEKEFVGFFTSSFYTGVFTLARPAK